MKKAQTPMDSKKAPVPFDIVITSMAQLHHQVGSMPRKAPLSPEPRSDWLLRRSDQAVVAALVLVALLHGSLTY